MVHPVRVIRSEKYTGSVACARTGEGLDKDRA